MVTDNSGPIHSNPAGTAFQIGSRSDYACACDSTLVMGEMDRGTDCPWAVHCADCFKTEIFQRLNRPKPGQTAPIEGPAKEDINPHKR